MHHIKAGKFHNSDNNIVSNEVINIKSLNQEISNFFLFKKLIFQIPYILNKTEQNIYVFNF